MKIYIWLFLVFSPFAAFCQKELAYSEFTPYVNSVRNLIEIPEDKAREVANAQPGYFYNPLKKQLNYTIRNPEGMTVKGSVLFKEGFEKEIIAQWYSQNVLRIEGQFINLIPVGTWNFYDTEEKLMKRISFQEDQQISYLIENYQVQLSITGNDTLISNGQGKYQTYWPSDSLHSFGSFRNGLKEGTWIGRYPDGTAMYTEEYQTGNLVRGESTDPYGYTFQYDSLVTQAKPVMGEDAYYEAIRKRLKYPIEARINGIEGTVFIEMIVNKDGSLSNFQVVQGIGYGCEKEIIRVVSQGPDWQPATIRGVPVGLRMIFPFQFRLGSGSNIKPLPPSKPM